MDLVEAHGQAMREFDHRVRQVLPEHWQRPTPCSDWSVGDLVQHLVREQLWAPELLAGCTVEQVGDRFDHDTPGSDPLMAWVLAAGAARESWTAPNALLRKVHVSSGRISAEEYGWQMTLDLTVHSWDLARGIGVDDRVDPALAAAVLSRVEPQVEAWRGSGMFGDAVPVPEDADDQDRLLGLLGRDPGR
ncbi:TIGR03086 family metal-binding protein [Umezawaea beigongshangensis]|uniref:TIGR03086 family metal-binding protein n=1 Tax=Umezawaea beigongshangensis TaxID=2780383 RepID=UPI0018F249FB|nr:TIGR03086 family metal-binding protein [Umezawaea beigongshangensis]